MGLGEFLQAAGSRKRDPGEWDCATFPAAWAIERGYRDPMAHVRGSYDTEESARAVIAAGGGLVALFDAALSAIGVGPAEGTPQAGDIGVIELLGEQAGGVYTGERWAFVAPRGIALATLGPEHVKGLWRVGHG